MYSMIILIFRAKLSNRSCHALLTGHHAADVWIASLKMLGELFTWDAAMIWFLGPMSMETVLL